MNETELHAQYVKLQAVLAKSWAMRVEGLPLKAGTVKYGDQQAAFLQGALAASVALEAMTQNQASMVAFLVSVGRGDEWLKPRV